MTHEEMEAIILNHARECLEIRRLQQAVEAARNAYKAHQDMTKQFQDCLDDIRTYCREVYQDLPSAEKGAAGFELALDASKHFTVDVAEVFHLYGMWVLAEARHEEAVAKHYEGLSRLVEHGHS